MNSKHFKLIFKLNFRTSQQCLRRVLLKKVKSLLFMANRSHLGKELQVTNPLTKHIQSYSYIHGAIEREGSRLVK
jgi:hypothetical protein